MDLSIPGRRLTLTIDVITVKDPIVKMPIKPTFCLKGIWSCRTIGNGSINRITSLIMLVIAVAIYRPGLLMHLPSVIVTSQFMAIGWQANITAKKMPMVYPLMNTAVDQTEILNHR